MSSRKSSPVRTLASLSGPEGLLVAVIGTAVNDAIAGRGESKVEARAFFAGPWYRHYCGLLGIPGTWLPEAIEEAAKAYESEVLVNVGRGAGSQVARNSVYR